MKTTTSVLNELLEKLTAMHEEEEDAGEVMYYVEDFIDMINEAKEKIK